MPDPTCATCRLHTISRRPQVVAEAMDTIVEFTDDDETVYHCLAPSGPYAGREIGTVPVSCPAYEPPVLDKLKAQDAELDRLMARFVARPSRKDDE